MVFKAISLNFTGNTGKDSCSVLILERFDTRYIYTGKDNGKDVAGSRLSATLTGSTFFGERWPGGAGRPSPGMEGRR